MQRYYNFMKKPNYFLFPFVVCSLIRTFEHSSKVLSFENKKEKFVFFLYFAHLFVPLSRHKYKTSHERNRTDITTD